MAGLGKKKKGRIKKTGCCLCESEGPTVHKKTRIGHTKGKAGRGYQKKISKNEETTRKSGTEVSNSIMRVEILFSKGIRDAKDEREERKKKCKKKLKKWNTNLSRCYINLDTRTLNCKN